MASIRDIKRQIISVHNTQKVTGAMKMVSAAKMRRTNDIIIATRPYESKMKEIISNILKNEERKREAMERLTPKELAKLNYKAYSNPLLDKPAEVKKIALLIMNSDRGLCGGFNILIEKLANSFIQEHSDKEIKLYILGKNAYDAFKRKDYAIMEKWISLGGKVSYETGKKVSERIVSDYLNKEFDEVYAVYNKMKSLSSQVPSIEKLLPLTMSVEVDALQEDGGESSYSEYIYEPEPHMLLDQIIPKYLYLLIYHMLLETAVGEHKARMVAMDSATTNAEEMVKKLQLNYNKARQAAITTDLLDILNGAEALK